MSARLVGTAVIASVLLVGCGGAAPGSTNGGSAVATVSAIGVVTAVSNGSATIQAGYHSADRGATWALLSTAQLALTLIQDPNNLSRFFGGDVVFGGRTGGVFISVDGARTFTPFGLEGRTCGNLAISGDGSRLFAGCYNSGIYMTRFN